MPNLVIAISSRALFDLDESHTLYEKHGVKEYAQYQIKHENKILQSGTAFSLVKKFLALKDPKTQHPLVDVILLSRNSADTGLRIFNSIQKHGLPITRAVFTNGENPYKYIQAFGANLFLSANPDDVANALKSGCAAGHIFNLGGLSSKTTARINIAFDGDAVLFSDEAEKIYQSQGLEAFQSNEAKSAHKPLPAGPFKAFLEALHKIQQLFPTDCPIRTALVTARSAPAHERVIRTLRHWGIRIDEAIFLGGLPKGAFLKAFGADFFFDDQPQNCLNSHQHVATAHVPHGVMNDHENT